MADNFLIIYLRCRAKAPFEWRETNNTFNLQPVSGRQYKWFIIQGICAMHKVWRQRSGLRRRRRRREGLDKPKIKQEPRYLITYLVNTFNAHARILPEDVIVSNIYIERVARCDPVDRWLSCSILNKSDVKGLPSDQRRLSFISMKFCWIAS